MKIDTTEIKEMIRASLRKELDREPTEKDVAEFMKEFTTKIKEENNK